MAANHLGTLKRDERELVEEQQTAWSQPQLPAAAPPLRESLRREVGGQWETQPRVWYTSCFIMV